MSWAQGTVERLQSLKAVCSAAALPVPSAPRAIIALDAIA